MHAIAAYACRHMPLSLFFFIHTLYYAADYLMPPYAADTRRHAAD